MIESDDIGGNLFRQEASELVQSIEAGLIALEQAPQDRARIDAVFRDLHTVKGSGAMFGFAELAAFIHSFETAFDRLRRGEVAVSGALIEISLQATDQILRLLDAPELAAEQSAAILLRLEHCLNGPELNGQYQSGHASASAAEPPAPDADIPDMAQTDPLSTNGWSVPANPWHPPLGGLRVVFGLAPGDLMRGHDPAMFLEELRGLGPCHVRALTDAVPPLDRLDPTECHLRWVVEIEGPVDSADIEAVFLFVRDTMTLEISPLPEAGDDTRLHAPAPATSASGYVAQSPGEVAPAIAPPDRSAAALPSRTQASGDTMRIATERLDELMDRVGELVIAEARLHSLAHGSGDSNLLAVAEEIQRLAAGLRDSTMSIRMVPLSSIVGRFQRLIRDLSATTGKPMTFLTRGEETALDKTVIEMLADPLVHILRNSADHGLERPEDRLAAGKPAAGTIELSAEQSGAEVVITIRDDGRGLDARRIRARAVENGLISATADLSETELFRLIFEPGFSTASEITELSGRGVGMDVVKRTISGLRGTIDLASEPGHGTTVRLRLPLTLAIIDGLLIEVGGEQYTIPLAAVEECVELPPDQATARGGSSFLNIRGQLMPFLRLRSLFGITAPPTEFQKVVIVASSGTRVGLVVDRIVANNQTVIKQLSPLHASLKSFSGATILGDGTVALILDVAQLVSLGRTLEDRSRREKALQERAA